MAVKKRNRPKPPTLQGILTRFYGSMLTPQQQRKQARRETNLAMKDSMRQLRTTYQREHEQTLREQYAQGAYAGLLRGFGQEGSAESQAVKDAYARAAGLSQAESMGFVTPTVGQATSNVAAGQASAENLAGYTGDIQGAIPGGANPSTSGQVLSYLAALPKGTFAAQAEAAAKGLGRAGAEAGSQFAFREAQLGQDLREQREQYQMAVKDLLAKRPGLLQEALGRQSEGSRQDFATILSAIGMQNTLQNTQFGQQLDVAQLGAEKYKTKADILRSMGLNPQGKPLPDYYRAPDGSVRKIPYGSVIGPSGKLVRDPNNPAAQGAGKKTAKATADRNRVLENTRADMLSALGDDPLYFQPPKGEWDLSTPAKRRVSRAKARQYLMTNFAADAIRRYPGQKATILKMVEQSLNSMGFKK